MKKYSRKCTECGEIIFYDYKSSWIRAKRNNSLCMSCSHSGKNHANYGKSLSKEICEKISKSNKGRIISKEQRENVRKANVKRFKNPKERKKISDINKGRTAWNKGLTKETSEIVRKYSKKKMGKKRKNSTIEKMRKSGRIAAIKRIEKQIGQLYPAYNLRAISIIEQKAKELGIDDLQHAENGGEFHIKELGYWVDGYSPSKNIVIEYMEKWHKNQKEKDERRKKEIIKELGCKFIEIKE